jgi:hypothetical protein
METLDLNIENYNLEDVLKLFNIEFHFGEEDLKKAKKMVLKTHPDKSGLKPDVFLFYSKAYKKLYSIWEFSSKHRLLQLDTNYTIDDIDELNHKNQLAFGKDKTKALETFLTEKSLKDDKKFNQWFNEEFEKTNLVSEEETQGYENWFKSNEDLDEINEKTGFNIDELEKKKKHMRDVIVHDGIKEMNANGSFGSQIAILGSNTYSSELFSNLHYEDLKKAYTETVIPVTMDDYNNVQKFNSVDEYKTHRSSQNMVPLSEQQANEYLNNRAKMENTETTFRAYKLANQGDVMRKRQDDFWSNIMKITNK